MTMAFAFLATLAVALALAVAPAVPALAVTMAFAFLATLAVALTLAVAPALALTVALISVVIAHTIAVGVHKIVTHGVAILAGGPVAASVTRSVASTTGGVSVPLRPTGQRDGGHRSHQQGDDNENTHYTNYLFHRDKHPFYDLLNPY